MGALKDKLLEEGTRPKLIADCAALVDSEVASKKGMSGMVIKTGYKAFTKIKPGIVTKAVDALLDDFVEKLDAHYEQFSQTGGSSFEGWAVPQDTKIANDLLGVTDDIMARTDKAAIKKIYNGLRKIAERNVAQAIPAVGRLVDKHMR